MRLRRVDVRDYWQQIKPHVEEILKGYDDIPEEVYAACRGGYAHLFMGEDDVGFTILKETLEGTRKNLFLWISYKKQESNSTDGMSYLEDIEQIAKQIGAKSMTFRTKRRGFERVLGSDWRVGFIEYEKKLNG